MRTLTGVDKIMLAGLILCSGGFIFAIHGFTYELPKAYEKDRHIREDSASKFVGLSIDDLLTKLGPPSKIDNYPDSKLTMLVYEKDGTLAVSKTIYMIKDGRVISTRVE